MATAAELARRNAAAMEGFRSSLRSAREGAETRAAFHAAELADRRREKQAEADRRAQTINTIVGMLGGLAQTGISSWAQSERQKAADIAAGERQRESDAARAASQLEVQEAADAARLNRERLADERQVMRDYSKYLREWQAPEVVAEPPLDLGTPALIRTQENRGAILDPESNSRGSNPLFKDTGERDDRDYPIYTENYDTFFEEGADREDPDAIAAAHENWRDALQDRTKETFWAIWHEKGVAEDANLLDPDGEPPSDATVAKWNRLYREGNYEGMEAMVGANRSFIAFHNFVYGPPTTVDEPTPAADPGPRTMGESLLRDADTPSAAAKVTPVVTGEGMLTDVVINALGGLYVPSSGEDHDPAPATERADRAKDALVRAEDEGNLTDGESGLVPQLIRFADHLQELESLNELQAAKGEEPQHDLAQDWFELEKWIQEIEQPEGKFKDVPSWWIHQRGSDRIRSGDVAVGAIEGQLGARIDNLRAKLPPGHPLRRHTTTARVIGGAGMPRQQWHEPE